MFKVGQKVRVRSHEYILEIQRHGRMISYNNDMSIYSGKIFTVKKLGRARSSEYRYDIWSLDIKDACDDYCEWIWDERWLEPIETLSEDLFVI